MKLKFNLLYILVPILIGIISCKEDFDVTPERSEFAKLELQLQDLEDLGPDYIYEGWVIADGSAISTGVFTVGSNGKPIKSSFLVEKHALEIATAFVLTIEPFPDNNPNASATHIIGGSFDGNTAELSIGHSSAFNTDFLNSTGTFILATPTDQDLNNENSGIWWLDPNAGPGPSLVLPALTSGWKYEGWVVIGGIAVSTGTFTDPNAKDDKNRYGGTIQSPAFPGEDFLFSAPLGLDFPINLASADVVISVEPDPDNAVTPFSLKPLTGIIPHLATDHFSYPMNNTITNKMPSGIAAR